MIEQQRQNFVAAAVVLVLSLAPGSALPARSIPYSSTRRPDHASVDDEGRPRRYLDPTQLQRRRESIAAARFVAGRTRGGAGPTPSSSKYTARVQYMITRSMRKTLIEELNYLPEEVDDMEPQVAAVVIDKSLPRPRTGMPMAWRRSVTQRRGGPGSGALSALRDGIANAFRSVGLVCLLPLRIARGAYEAGRQAASASKGAALPALGVAAVAVLFWQQGLPLLLESLSSRGSGKKRSPFDADEDSDAEYEGDDVAEEEEEKEEAAEDLGEEEIPQGSASNSEIEPLSIPEARRHARIPRRSSEAAPFAYEEAEAEAEHPYDDALVERFPESSEEIEAYAFPRGRRSEQDEDSWLDRGICKLWDRLKGAGSGGSGGGEDDGSD